MIAAGAWSHLLAQQLRRPHPAGDRARLQHDAAEDRLRREAAADLLRATASSSRRSRPACASAARSSLAASQRPPNFARSKAMLEKAQALPAGPRPGRRSRMDGLSSVAAGFTAGHRPARSRRRNVFYAFGHGHLGLTQSAATARLVRDLVTRRSRRRSISPLFGRNGSDRRRASMARHSFFCIDGHTCGNPVRLVAGGGPLLAGRDDDGAARAFPRRI